MTIFIKLEKKRRNVIMTFLKKKIGQGQHAHLSMQPREQKNNQITTLLFVRNLICV
jgi:hypothetical protein